MVQVGGVGERTNNLFDKTQTNRKLSQARNGDGTMNYTTTSSNFFDYYIAVQPNTQYIVTDERYAPSRIYFFKSDKTWIGRTDLANGPAYPKSRVFTTPSNCYYIQFQESKDNMMNENTLMLNEGTTSLPYEPYGYKVPVVCGGTKTTIYLDEPIDARANIPNEYEEVEYIETDGNQYINIPFDNTNVSINKYYYKYMHRNPLDKPSTILGNTMDTDENRIGILWFGTDNTTKMSIGNAVSTNSIFNTNIILQKKIEVTVLVNNQNRIYSVNYNGKEYNNNSFNGSSQTSRGLKIWGRGKGTDQSANIVFYRMKIYSDNALIRDFIPCYRKSDNVAGLYDLVNNTFYTNQGTGNFRVGPIKENESISLSDTNTNIPTIRGTNVLSVDTTVQPNNVYVKSRHESSYETAMRERYEEAQAQLDALENGGE